ncbi:MAG: hypothetical protein LBI88_03215 [Deltaproteobacteria bacterium]|jgi:hypothetical protein|nr:hypothetical protein [Deltaproteobacteria bacterium]
MSTLRLPSLPFAVLLVTLILSSCGGKKLPKAPVSAPAEKERVLVGLPSKAETRKHPNGDGSAVPRADPGYLQWLEKQSMLADAGELARIVSGSELPWRSPVAGGQLDILLDAADTWLFVHPSSLLTEGSRPTFKELAEGSALDLLKQVGIRGIFVAPAHESGSVWREKNAMPRTEADDDPVSLRFSEHAGNDKDFKQFSSQAEKRHIQLGGDILSPATGVGPDFALAARALREYPGAYMMVEIPRAHWTVLPPAPNPNSLEGLPLNQEQIAALNKERLLPPAMARDSLDWTNQGGWAATGEIRCSDGQLRRWVFRYHTQPARPLLSWEDPSGAAQRILSGSIIQQVGVLRQALAGIHIDPLFGLDALYHPAQRSLEPAPSALRSLAREIRRYGGWSIQRDPVPTGVNAQLLDAGVDFIPDNITSPAAEYALLTGDVAPLRALLTQALHFDQRRFVRGMPDSEGIRFQALGASPFPPDALQKLHLILAGQTECPWDGNTLYATGPSLATLVMRAQQTERAKADSGPLGPHLLLTAFRAAMPGLFRLSGADLTGALNISVKTPPAHAVLGGWSLGSAWARSATRKGFERALTVYPPLNNQSRQPNSYLSQLGRLNTIRAKYKVAQGTLLGPLQADAPSVLPLLTRLPGGGYLLAAANFSPKGTHSGISLPASLGTADIQDLMTAKNIARSGDQLSLELGPWACRILLIGGKI